MDMSNSHSFIVYMNQFGIFAPLIAFMLFVIQAILPIFPYVILTAAGGILFGFKMGFMLAWLGALTGACLAFWLCRLLGDSVFMQRYYTLLGYDASRLNSAMAFWTIVAARILPVIPTPLINVSSALSGVSFITFLGSSALGKIPTALLYTGLGLALFNAKDVHTALLIMGLILLVGLLIRYQAKKYSSPRVT